MFARLFIFIALLATCLFAAPLRSSRDLSTQELYERDAEEQALAERHVIPAEVATRSPNGQIKAWSAARSFDDFEEVQTWEERSLDEELEWEDDVSARDFEEDMGGLEERSKIGNKIKNFFKKVGGFVKKVVGL
ncbi:hypothetical protein CALCODRAFT_512866 [Calocera cornea HHB12733]|uniref:Uncharacterized protein n=1 Tax=Calocera cornea HHB12733 TaxID=1353952 RepID=A0A165CQC6_9BASI|nr:hypothetical protein CALCODRAFT_512866 [Calocera cornea HHB12733]